MKRRQALRDTWVSQAKHNNISVFFVIGLTNDNRVQNMLESESNKYQDIIQLGFVDHYYNLTLKAISILEWIHNFCNNSKTILKTDDDVVVNVNKLMESSEDLEDDFIGYLLKTEVPFRNENSVWFVPQNIYPDSNYPIYMRGSAYMMRTRNMGQLLAAVHNYSGLMYDIDDMFITGIIASKVGFGRSNSQVFHLNSSCDVKDVPICQMHSYLVLGECNERKAFSQFWNEWQNSSHNDCESHQNRQLLFITIFVIFLLILFIIMITKLNKKLSSNDKFYNLNV